MKQIFPKEIINNTIEVHRFKHSVNSKIIYGILLLSIIGIGASLPFVNIDIYSSARGILKSEKERNQITTLYSGKIKRILIRENQLIQKGDTLLIIDNQTGNDKLKLIRGQIEETNLFLHDLSYLSSSQAINQDSLHSFLYQKQYLQYIQKISELKTRYSKARRDYHRQLKLYKKEVIAKVEFENSKYNYNLAINALKQFKEQQRNQWQAELTQLNNKLKELKNTFSQYKNELDNHVITASITGTIQNIKGLEAGNYISAGTVIAEISPDTDLIAECYISPTDIGLLKTDNPVKFQIDAFNFNQWGMATGKIKTIGKDIVMINNTPLFKIICTIDQNELQLKNGFKGKLKKGMTLNARFFIANRSVFDLLYDKVDDWFNPSRVK